MNWILTTLWTTGFILCAATTGAVAQTNGDLSLQLFIISSPIGPIEPLQFQLVITNAGARDVQGLAPWAVRGYTVVEFRARSSSAWQSLEVPSLNRYATEMPISGLPLFALQARESQTVDLSVVCDQFQSYRDGRIKYYFSQPGEYLLRATYTPANGWTIRSKEVNFRVEVYSGPDAVAYEWLKTRSIPHFMYDFDVYTHNNAYETVADAREIITRFPNSRFAPLSKLYLARCYAFGLRQSKARIDPPDLQKAAELARELADTADPNLRKGAAALLKEIEQKRK